MMKFKKGLALVLAGVLSAAALAGCASKETPPTDAGNEAAASGEVTTIKFAGVTSESAKLACEKFKEIAEAESGGTLKIELYPDNMLGDDRVAIETTIMGDIDIGSSSTSPLATMFSDFYLFDAPYLFLSKEDAYKNLDGEMGQSILTGLESIGLKGLALWENGFRNFTNNKVAVAKPEDVKGMKVRTMENEVHLAAWKALGANPTPMAFTELFTALQQGTVDAQENPLGIIDANKFAEVQKYVSLTQHVYTPYIIAMNLEKYNSLTDVQKAAIDKASAESTDFQRQESTRIEEEILAGFEGQGVTVVEPTTEEKAQWQKVIIDDGIYDLVRGKMEHPEYVDLALEK